MIDIIKLVFSFLAFFWLSVFLLFEIWMCFKYVHKMISDSLNKNKIPASIE